MAKRGSGFGSGFMFVETSGARFHGTRLIIDESESLVSRFRA